MGQDSKIEWTDHTQTLAPRYNESSPRGAGNTAAGSNHKHPLYEKGHVVAVSTLSFRAYVSQLTGRRLGAFKRSAAVAGITFDEYVDRIERGLKRCSDCEQWKDRSEFVSDTSRWDGHSAKCRACSSDRGKAAHVPVLAESLSHMGPARDAIRPGDKVQARHFVNLEVARGQRPNPNDLFCAQCGHKGNDRRHEYHHHMGYSLEHFFDVVALCTECHHDEHPIDRERNQDGTFSGKAV